MKYHILAEDRKAVKTKLEELTGKKASYSGAPTFTYTLDGFSIGTKGTVETTDEADEEVLQKLIEAGFLEAEEEEPAEAAQEAPVAEAETEAEEVPTETDEAPQTAQEAPQDADGDGTAAESEAPDELKPTYSYPLSQHRPDSICNLVFTIYSKGDLLDKSTGGDFFVSEALKEKLKNGSFRTNGEVLAILKEAGSGDLRGLSFTDEKVTFTGFPETNDPAVIGAWLKLAEAINRAAIQHKRVQPKRNEETNEKFAFRTWLTRIGMNGPELKPERAIYYRSLTGHTAFRTPADAEHWKELQKVRAEKKKAAQAAGNTPEQTNENA